MQVVCEHIVLVIINAVHYILTTPIQHYCITILPNMIIGTAKRKATKLQDLVQKCLDRQELALDGRLWFH